jgi:hypothetical protein
VLFLGEALGGLLVGGKMAYTHGGANIAPLGIVSRSPLAELNVFIRNITLAVVCAEPAAARTVGGFIGTRAVVRSLAAAGVLERELTPLHDELTRLMGPAGLVGVTLGAISGVRACMPGSSARDRLHRQCPQNRVALTSSHHAARPRRHF